MDPLVVASGIGKLVHMFLGDSDPFAGDFALAYKLGDALECFKNFHGETLATSPPLHLGVISNRLTLPHERFPRRRSFVRPPLDRPPV